MSEAMGAVLILLLLMCGLVAVVIFVARKVQKYDEDMRGGKKRK